MNRRSSCVALLALVLCACSHPDLQEQRAAEMIRGNCHVVEMVLGRDLALTKSGLTRGFPLDMKGLDVVHEWAWLCVMYRDPKNYEHVEALNSVVETLAVEHDHPVSPKTLMAFALLADGLHRINALMPAHTVGKTPALDAASMACRDVAIGFDVPLPYVRANVETRSFPFRPADDKYLTAWAYFCANYAHPETGTLSAEFAAILRTLPHEKQEHYSSEAIAGYARLVAILHEINAGNPR